LRASRGAAKSAPQSRAGTTVMIALGIILGFIVIVLGGLNLFEFHRFD
jgi:hypothetical protein